MLGANCLEFAVGGILLFWIFIGSSLPLPGLLLTMLGMMVLLLILWSSPLVLCLRGGGWFMLISLCSFCMRDVECTCTRIMQRHKQQQWGGWPASKVAESRHRATPTPGRGFGWELVNLGEPPTQSDLRSFHRALLGQAAAETAGAASQVP